MLPSRAKTYGSQSGPKGTIIAISLPNGSQIAIATGYGSKVNMTAVTNAVEAVATLAAGHGLAVGDYVEVTSGWSRMDGKVLKVKTVATNDVTFTGFDTSSTAAFPAGSGTGSIRKLNGWQQIQQILSTSSTGGEQQFVEYQLLEADAQRRIPTTKSAGGLTVSIADDPDLNGYKLASAANDDRLPRGIRVLLPSTKEILYNAHVSLNKTPTLTVNEIMACEMTLSFVAEPHRV